MRYEVMAEENDAKLRGWELYSESSCSYFYCPFKNLEKRNVYRIMMDENGISIWMNDLPLHEIGYGAEFE